MEEAFRRFSTNTPTARRWLRRDFRRRESACRLRVTSSVALEIVSYLKSRGEKLIWPDRHLGDYICRETGADMLLLQVRIVHNEFKGQELAALKAEHPEAVVLVHHGICHAKRHWTGRRGRLDQHTAQGRRIASWKKNSSWRPIWASCMICKSRRPTENLSPRPDGGNGGSCFKAAPFCPWLAMHLLGGIRYFVTSGRQRNPVGLGSWKAARYSADV